ASKDSANRDNIKKNNNTNNDNNHVDGLDLLVKAAQKVSLPSKGVSQKKPKAPTMHLNGSYETPVIVGRGSQATLNLGRINKQVSRRHAIIQWCHEVSAFQIIVLGQNGVRINGTGYPSGQQTILREGDVVDLVGVKMLFCAPVGAPPPANRDYQDLTHFEISDLDQTDDNHRVDSTPAGLMTPKRTQKTNPAHQLATPIHSSPIRESPQLASTARMRYKILKHNPSSDNRTSLNSPPPSSDPATEFDYESRPIFTLAMDNPPNQSSFGPESPRSEHDVFVDDLSLKDPPLKALNQRLPLAPLALQENRQVNTPKSLPTNIHMDTKFGGKSVSNNIQKSPAPLKSVSLDVNANRLTSEYSHQKAHVGDGAAAENGAKASIESKPEKPKTTKAKSKEHTRLTHTSLDKQERKKEKEVEKSFKDVKSTSKESTARKINVSKQQDIATTTTKPSLEEDQKSEKKEASSVPSSSQELLSDIPVQDKKTGMDYTEMIIDTLVFARKKKSMTLSELFDEMIASQPSLMRLQTQEEIKEQMLQCLSAARCVGKITRKGKDAYNKPLESQWYYIPEYDHNVMRKLTRQEVMPSARKCTLTDKQYFFKMPPKLPYHRKTTSPYAVKSSSRRTKESSKLSSAVVSDDEGADEHSSSSGEEEEDAESTLLQSTIRKRKSANVGRSDKKRKSTTVQQLVVNAVSSSTHDGSGGNGNEDEEDDDAHNDSLDDLSELSGLSD
ncbi:hypothetical protein BX616_007870, partial [Lobosporangium transversale]